jgi:hypothetical protein
MNKARKLQRGQRKYAKLLKEIEYLNQAVISLKNEEKLIFIEESDIFEDIQWSFSSQTKISQSEIKHQIHF